MSTILIQEPIVKQRTEPKLPKIINKDLTVLPWDWELPSTILKSGWAKKHNQCVLDFYDKSRNSYCGQGLLLHYYDWKGSESPISADMEASFGKMFGHNYPPLSHPIRMSLPFYQLARLNDQDLLKFEQLGEFMKEQGQ